MTKPLSEQVAELEAELEETRSLLDYATPLSLKWTDFCKLFGKGPHGEIEQVLEWAREGVAAERDDLQRQVQEARDECDALRAGQGRWPGETIASEDVPFKGMSDLRYKEPTKPEQPTYAPDVPDLHVNWSGERATGYADEDEDHQDAEVTDWHQPTPRLTVHDLEVAPVGSRVGFSSIYFTKGDDGWWTFNWDGIKWTGEALVGTIPTATLTTPEDA